MYFDDTQYKQKGLAPILIIVILAGAIVLTSGAYYLGTRRSETSISSSQPPQPTPPATDETVYTEATRSANWKTYISKNFNLSIRYPVDWKVFGDFSIENKPISNDSQGQAYYDAINGRITFSVNTMGSSAFCGGDCKTPLTKDTFYDLKQRFWKLGQEGSGGFICHRNLLKVYESTVGDKKAIVKEVIHNLCNDEVGYPKDQASLGYYVYQNIPGQELLVFNFDYYDKNPDKAKLIKIFNQIINSVEFLK